MASAFKDPKKPAPLDVGAVTSAANTQNVSNAAANAQLNRLDQTDAYGNRLTFGDDGSVSTSLGALGSEFQGGLASLGRKYLDTAGAGIPDSSAAFGTAYDYATRNLEPRFARAEDATRNRFANQGLDPTSEAYKSGMNDLALQQNEARNSLVSSLQNQMFQQGLAGRQQQLSELAPGLAYGTGSTQGNFANYNPVTQDNVNVAQLYGQQNQNAWQGYNADVQRQNALYGALASLAGTATQAAMPWAFPKKPTSGAAAP